MEKKQTRIKDIAKKAGVSTGTVDRVIHNRGEVSPATRKKILDIVAELDYQPNLLASTLASKKNYRFGVLIPAGSDQNPYWKMPITGILKAGEELKPYGVTLDVRTYSTTSTSDFRKISQAFLKDKPDALLLAPAFYEESKRFLARCEEEDLPIVFIDAQLEYDNTVQFIGQNSCQSGHVAARLLGMGQKPDAKYLIFNITGEKDQLYHFRERARGFQSFFEIRKQRSIINIHDVDRSGVEKIKLILKKESSDKNGIAGIFVTGAQVYRIAAALQELEMTKIRVLGFDLVEQNLKHLQSETIDFLISQQPEEQGYLGIQTLYSVLIQNQFAEKQRHTPIDIITLENLDHYINCP